MNRRTHLLSDTGIILFAVIAFAAITTAVAAYFDPSIFWCEQGKCSVQYWLGAASEGLATMLAFGAVVVAFGALRAQNAATSTELRAYVFLDKAEYEQKSDTIFVALRNCGATPAQNIKILLDMTTLSSPASSLIVPDDNLMVLGAIGPDRFNTLDWPKISVTFRDSLKAIQRSTEHICVGGHVEYDDVFGGRHRLNVHLALPHDGKKFSAKLDIIKQELVSDIG